MKTMLTVLLSLSLAGALLAASPAAAPATYQVNFETSAGDFVVQVNREWAPQGADRFYELVNAKYYDGCRFFRVVKDFMVQWGINGDPAVSRKWATVTIKDDSVKKTNSKGRISFATSGPNMRTTQVFINYGDNTRLDHLGFAPFGEVVSGMDVVEKIFAMYGEEPDQGKIREGGNDYLSGKYPRLDYIKKATIVPAAAP